MECGCGRSPKGKCIGWHKVSEEEDIEKLEEYKDKEKEEDQKFCKLNIGCQTPFLNKIRQQVKIRGEIKPAAIESFDGDIENFRF